MNTTVAAVPPVPPAAPAAPAAPAPSATDDAAAKLAEQKAAEKAAAKAAKDAEKAAKAKEREDAKAAKEAEKAAKKAEREAKKAEREAKKVVREKMPEQNGIRQPKPGGLCAQVWDLASSMVKDGVVPAMSDVLDAAKAKGLNEGNARTEYARWRKFHGHPSVGRKKKEEAPVPPVPPAPAE